MLQNFGLVGVFDRNQGNTAVNELVLIREDDVSKAAMEETERQLRMNSSHRLDKVA